MAYADDLLEQAQHLARREPKRPKQASLRRAVEQRYALARAFDDGRMRTASERKLREVNELLKTSHPPASESAAYTHLRKIAATFLQLQQQRHTADYDGSKQWSRTEALTQVGAAAAAFDSWNKIRDEVAAQDYLISLLVKDR